MTVGRLGRELLLVCLAALAISAVLTWPTLADPAHTIPADAGDPLLVTWAMAWEGHALLTDPASLWNTNAFYPEQLTLAYTDSLLGYAPLALIGSGPAAALVHYNLLFWLVPALALVGAYALARQLGARVPGALVAGLAFAYAPWRLGQAGHLHVISSGGIALALAMLARGYGYSFRGGYQPQRVKPGWIVAGWLVAAWQLTLGFGIGLPFAYVLLLGCLTAVVWWLVKRPPLSRPLILCTLGGGLAFAAVGALMARPYLQLVAQYPNARRTIGDVELFSVPPSGFFAAPNTSLFWGPVTQATTKALPFSAEMAVLPGVVVVVLALAGLGFGVWSARQRSWLGIGVAASAVLCMGTNVLGGTFTYLPLLALPGWDALRTPGRLILWTTLFLGLLAAGFLTYVQERLEAREPTPGGDLSWRAMALMLPALLVGLEGANTLDHPVPAPPPAAMRTAAAPILVLPSDGWWDLRTMWWSTDGFPRMANGASGFTPPSTAAIRTAAEHFPDAGSVAYLRRAGIRTVILVPDSTYGTPWEHAAEKPVGGLGITRTVSGNAVVYGL